MEQHLPIHIIWTEASSNWRHSRQLEARSTVQRRPQDTLTFLQFHTGRTTAGSSPTSRTGYTVQMMPAVAAKEFKHFQRSVLGSFY